MAESEHQIQTWEEFLKLKGTKEKKLESLKKNTRLLFSNPRALRQQVWDSQIPENFRTNRLYDYGDHGESGDSLNKDLGVRLTSIIENHVNIVCKQYHIQDEEQKEIIKNSVKCFAYHTMVVKKKLCYDAVWTFLSGCLNQYFPPDDAYVYMSYIICYLYPRNFFEPNSANYTKRYHLHVFAKAIEDRIPKLADKLICTKKILNCVDCQEQTKLSRKGLVSYAKKLGDAYIVKIFAAHVDAFALLKNLDFLFLEGFDYVHKVALKVVLKMWKNSYHAIKKYMQGKETNEVNLMAAALVSTNTLLNPIQRCDFMRHTRSSYLDKDLQIFWAENKGHFEKEVTETLNKSIKVAKENRMAYLVKTKNDFIASGITLDEKTVETFNSSFNKFAHNKKKNPKGLVSYENTFDLLTKKSGVYKWNASLANSFYFSVDPRLKGAITAAEFKGILTLLSAIADDSKIYIICGHLEDQKDGKIKLNTAPCVLEKLEDLIYPGLKGCNATSDSIVSETEQKFQDQEMIELANFLEFSKNLEEYSDVNQVPTKLTSYHEKANEVKQTVEYEQKDNSLLGKSPNLSFNNGDSEAVEEFNWNPINNEDIKAPSTDNCSIY